MVIPNLVFRYYKFSVSYFVMSHTTECTLCLCVYIHVHIRGRMYVYAYIYSILLPTVFHYLEQKRHEGGLLFMCRPNKLEMKSSRDRNEVLLIHMEGSFDRIGLF